MVQGQFLNHFGTICQGPGAWSDHFWTIFGPFLNTSQKTLKKHVWTILIKIHDSYSLANPRNHKFFKLKKLPLN